MTAMIAGVRNNPVLRHKLFQIDYLTTLSNQAVVSLLYHKKLDDEWRQEAEALRDALRAQNLNVHLIGRATKTKIELDQDYIDERLPVAGKEMIYRQVENSFTPAERGDEYSDAGMGAGRNQRLKRRFTGAVLRQR
ncbi:tRNA (uracil-5)-methyltransferase [Escherichia coli]|uniref:tRNA (Uracil-5)-methyltransferase n=1 Tax=Escherichia coli TaxID=562 RepID=A0A485JLV7_ECOLX|nr:tRNA (uracil-5)-methyltransferase [Escherichia coli]